MKKSEGRDKCFALGTWVLAKWVTLWRKCLLRGDGPNRVSRVFCVGRKVTKSLAVVQPLLFLFGCGVGVVRDDVFISLLEEGVPLGAKFIKFFSIKNCGPKVF